jgi:hypothetical protein
MRIVIWKLFGQEGAGEGFLVPVATVESAVCVGKSAFLFGIVSLAHYLALRCVWMHFEPSRLSSFLGISLLVYT